MRAPKPARIFERLCTVDRPLSSSRNSRKLILSASNSVWKAIIDNSQNTWRFAQVQDISLSSINDGVWPTLLMIHERQKQDVALVAYSCAVLVVP